MTAKYIFVTGGVVSSLGKGIAAASIGCLLEGHGYKVSNIKIDPYLNFDPGTQNPGEHGEVFVTDDGTETDLDLGHYERFTNQTCSRISNFTSGQVYNAVIERERKGDYLGQTIQIIPHITNEIKNRIRALEQENTDFIICEIGGTVGDIESMPMLEAIRQMKFDIGIEHILYVHLALAPYIKASGESKTKPIQHSVKELREIGIQPNLIICRSEYTLEQSAINKISLFCNVDNDCVFQSNDVDDIYKVPIEFSKQHLDMAILSHFGMKPSRKNDEYLKEWKCYLDKKKSSFCNIALFGKYGLKDAYKSIDEALKHAGVANGCQVNIVRMDAEQWDAKPYEQLESMMKKANIDGVLVPGGFGNRGIEGKIKMARYCREYNVPYFGICLGMQVAIIEFARNVLGFDDANSTEFEPKTKHPVIDLLEDQKKQVLMGGTMRLGNYICDLNKASKAYQIYNDLTFFERHRHRYEFNSIYLNELHNKGMIASGTNPNTNLVEIIELKNHPWFLGCQFHPEFKSRPLKPHPLFISFIKEASLGGSK